MPEDACERAREVGASVIVVEGCGWSIEEVIHLDAEQRRYARVA